MEGLQNVTGGGGLMEGQGIFRDAQVGDVNASVPVEAATAHADGNKVDGNMVENKINSGETSFLSGNSINIDLSGLFSTTESQAPQASKEEQYVDNMMSRFSTESGRVLGSADTPQIESGGMSL